MRFAIDKNNKRVCIDDVDREEIFYCQECGEKLVQRRGKIKAHHFAHFPNTVCIDAWHYDESEWHYFMQNLFPNDTQEIVLELDGKKHRADVLVKERNLVIEFQGDRIRQTEFQARNEFFTKLGYTVLWVFDESRPFENGSIDDIDTNKSRYRRWSRPSKTFEDFCPENTSKIEVWFAKKKGIPDDFPNFFRILCADSIRGFGLMECSHCYSQKELLDYILKGIKTIDRSVLYDVHWSVRRTDRQNYIYKCPLFEDPFTPVENCELCEFCESFDELRAPMCIHCSGRCRKTNLENMTQITNIMRNTEGFITSIEGSNDDGEFIQVSVDVPPTSLRTLVQLWEKYKPVKYLWCFNVKTEKRFKVFNPAWQKLKYGEIKGYIIFNSRPSLREITVYGADEPVWIVTYFTRPEKD